MLCEVLWLNYEYLWKVLEELIVDFTKKGVTVPQELVDDLKSARTLINIHRVDPAALEIATDIELNLAQIESNLLYFAESDVSAEYADRCLKRIDEARKRGLSEERKATSRFVSGVPKGKQWIRISVSDMISDKEMDGMLKELNLSCKPQDDGYLLIYGKDEDLKTLVKEISKRIKGKTLDNQPS